MAKCRLSAGNEQYLSALIGISYQAIYSRGGWGNALEAWRDAHTADTIVRDARRQPIAVHPKIREGQFVSGASAIWMAQQVVEEE